MSEKLELALEVLDETAESNPGEYYYQMVNNLTADAQHAATHMSKADIITLSRFAEDVKSLHKADKEK